MQIRISTRILALFIALATFVAIGCGEQQSDKKTTVPTADPNMVEIKGNAFVPNELNIAKGTKITIVNMDPIQHNLTCGDTLDSGAIDKGKSGNIVFEKEGTYNCKDRLQQGPNLKMKITVK